MGHSDYPLHEFAQRLANVEEKYAKEIQGIVECFTQSRVDLPVKKMEDMTKARIKTSRQLRKAVDDKKNELVNLWKLCNIYSATAVDVDEAMREIRGNLRKRIKPVAKESAFKRFVDEYRPSKQRQSEAPYEIYDANKPTLKEKQRFLLFKREKKEKLPLYHAEQSYTQHLVDVVKASLAESPEKDAVPPPSVKKNPPPKPPTAKKPQMSPQTRKSSENEDRTEPVKPVAAPRTRKSVSKDDITTSTLSVSINRGSHENVVEQSSKPHPTEDVHVCTNPLTARLECEQSKLSGQSGLSRNPSSYSELSHRPPNKNTTIHIGPESGPTMVVVDPDQPEDKSETETSNISDDLQTTIPQLPQYPRLITSGKIQRFRIEQSPAPRRMQAQIVLSPPASILEEETVNRL